MKITIELSPDEISNGEKVKELADIISELARATHERNIYSDNIAKAEQPPQEPKYKQGQLRLRELIS